MTRQVMIFNLSVQRGRLPGYYRQDYREIEHIIPDNVINSIHRVFCHHPVNVTIKVIIFDMIFKVIIFYKRCLYFVEICEIFLE